MLRVDPKTFLKWLLKEAIDPVKQVNLAEPRERYLTEEQLAMLGKHHGRILPPLDGLPEPTEPLKLAILAEQKALLASWSRHRGTGGNIYLVLLGHPAVGGDLLQ